MQADARNPDVMVWIYPLRGGMETAPYMNDPVPDVPGRVRHDYYLKTDAEMAVTHTRFGYIPLVPNVELAATHTRFGYISLVPNVELAVTHFGYIPLVPNVELAVTHTRDL